MVVRDNIAALFIHSSFENLLTAPHRPQYQNFLILRLLTEK